MHLPENVMNYLEYCQYRKELDSKTVKAYRIDLRQYFENVSQEIPEKNEIERYITNLHKKFRQKTVKRKLASIRAYYNYLEEQEIIPESPLRKIKLKFREERVLPRIIPRNEIERLLDYMYSLPEEQRGKECFWLRDIAVVEVCFGTGARVCEISGIRRENVDFETGSIRIMGKGGKERYLQIADESVLSQLKKYYEKNEAAIKQSGFFFVNRDGKRFTEQSIRSMIKKYTKLAGIERNITPHMFRHSVATYLIEEGADVTCIQQLLGHSSIKTSQIYIHVARTKQAEILKRLHPRNKMKIGVAA